MWDHFGYERLGALSDATVVLEITDWSGGGTGRFMYLLLLRCEVVTIAGTDRLLLKYVDTFGLGDRFMGEIVLRGDRIEIEAQPFNRYQGLQESTTYRPNLGRW